VRERANPSRPYANCGQDVARRSRPSAPKWEPGKWPLGGGGERALSGDDAYGAIRALDATSGALKWEFRLHSPSWVGTLATAGGVVFSGSDEGNFYALDAETGKPLWDI
jgi:alcohol dehydrogenase (cytochrome c)